MKSFLEEYGFAILAAIVVILIIAMCTPVGNLIKRQVMNVVDSFAGKSESKLAAVDAGEDSVLIKQSAAGEIEVTVTSNSTTDKFDVQYRVKADKSGWQNWIDLADLEKNESKQHIERYTITAQDGYSVQVRAKNIGKNDNHYMESNIIRYKADFVANGESSQGSSEDSSDFQASLDAAMASLNDGEVIEVFDANGGTFPHGETSIIVRINVMENSLVGDYPYFSDSQSLDHYINGVTKAGFVYVGNTVDPQGMSEKEFWQSVSPGDVIYFDANWRRANNRYPILEDGDTLYIYHGNGGYLSDGRDASWYFTGTGENDIYIQHWDSELEKDFVKEGYIRNGDDVDTQGLSDDEFWSKVESNEIKVVYYFAKWTTRNKCIANGGQIMNDQCWS